MFGLPRHVNPFGFRLVVKYRREAVERPPVKVEVTVFAPIAGVPVLVVSDTTEVSYDDRSDISLDALRNNVF